ncbi:MAG: trypsin-like peptidase domain-containing protein [Candidatus Taylorbacteria bacterium]|nr:trypsin-like peptidase domain-containing protein [Candidatus Taylorbacteria bacterium]
MEHLTKQQIVLLCLLVSFVSSIATGIVTVSLLDQAPPAVTQTINRVVERTIERAGASATTTKETIVVKDDQATVDAIAKASKAIARIYNEGRFIGIGVIVSGSGRIIAHTGDLFGGAMEARLEGGNVVSAEQVSRDPVTGISVFQAEQSSDPRSARVYSAASLAEASSLRLGQAVIAIGGIDTPSVATGIVSSLEGTRIRTSVRDPSFDSQAVLVNLLGEVVGMKDQIDTSTFSASNQINKYATP